MYAKLYYTFCSGNGNNDKIADYYFHCSGAVMFDQSTTVVRIKKIEIINLIYYYYHFFRIVILNKEMEDMLFSEQSQKVRSQFNLQPPLLPSRYHESYLYEKNRKCIYEIYIV